jgi:hypothetical protein
MDFSRFDQELQPRATAAWCAPHGQDVNGLPGLVHPEVDVVLGPGHEDTAKSGTARRGPPHPGPWSLAKQPESLFEFVGEQRRRGWAVLHPPLFDSVGLSLRTPTDSELHVALATGR